jgi:hypothetical protein
MANIDRFIADDRDFKVLKGIKLAYCPTGEGGGVSNSCPPANKGAGEDAIQSKIDEMTPADQARLMDFKELGRLEDMLVAARQAEAEAYRLWRQDQSNAQLKEARNETVRARRALERQIRLMRAALDVQDAAAGETRHLDPNRPRRARGRRGQPATPASDRQEQREDAARNISRATNALHREIEAQAAEVKFKKSSEAYYNGTYHPQTWIGVPQDPGYNTGQENWKYEFKTTSDRKFRMSMRYDLSTGRAALAFSDNTGSYEVTGNGEQHQIFGNVVPATLAFIDQYKPKKIHFTAAEYKRQKLYRFLTKTVIKLRPNHILENSGGYSFDVLRTGDGMNLSADPEDDKDLEPEVNPAWFLPSGWEPGDDQYPPLPELPPIGVTLAFCPTGEGGKVNNSCSPANKGTGKSAEAVAADAKSAFLAHSFGQQVYEDDVSGPMKNGKRWYVGIRHWGKWQTPSDVEEDEEDYDWQEPTEETIQAGTKIAEDLMKSNPNVKIEIGVGEKNWLEIYVEGK